MKNRFNCLNYNLIVTSPKNIRLCSSFNRFSFSNLLSEFNNIIKLTLTRQQSSPSFLITILNTVTIKEQMSKIISWVNTKVSARCNQREEECRNISARNTLVLIMLELNHLMVFSRQKLYIQSLERIKLHLTSTL